MESSDMQGLLSLKWNNHRTTFLKVLFNLCLKECHSDATIICQGKHFPAHKLVLATCSDYFEQIFFKTDCKHPFIIVNELKPKDLEALLNFMYKGEVNVPQDSLPGLIKAAEILSIKGLAVPDEVSNFEKGHAGNGKNKDFRRKVSSPLSKRKRTSFYQTEEDPNGLFSKKYVEESKSRLEATSPISSAYSNDTNYSLKSESQFVEIKKEPIENFDLPNFSSNIENYEAEANNTESNKEKTEKSNKFLDSLTNHDQSAHDIFYPRDESYANAADGNETHDTSPRFSSTFDYTSTGQVSSDSSLSRMMDKTDKKIFCCEFCPYKCYNRTHALYHLRKHTGEKPFMCPICFKQFSVKHNLDRHKLTAHRSELSNRDEQAGLSRKIV